MTGPDTTGDELVDARTPEGPVVLSDLASELLGEAAESSSGTSAISLTPTDAKAFTQTLVAVAQGHRLDAQHWNGPASVHVVTGAATLTGEGPDTALSGGQWARIPSGSGAVQADEDLVVLLTVAPA